MPAKNRSVPGAGWGALIPLALLSLAFAKDPPRASKARDSFEKIRAASTVSKNDLQACIDAQEEDLKKAKKSDTFELRYRKGYCSLLTAELSRDHAAFERAEKELAAASEGAKDEPAPTIEALFAIARLSDERALQQTEQTAKDLRDAIDETDCAKSGYVGKPECETVLSAGRLWLGWQALRADRLSEARKYFEKVPASPWNIWLTGITASESNRWTEAAGAFEKAAAAWRPSGKDVGQEAKSASDLLSPQPDRGGLYARLGSAQYMAGKYADSLPALNMAVQENRDDPYLIFLRARALESLGRRAEALPDFEAAANAASNLTSNPTSGPKHSQGEAHFYRAILLLRRNSLAAASKELSYASNMPLSRIPHADIAAWNMLVQARASGCKTSVAEMEIRAAAASVVFPKSELEDLEFDCRVQKAASYKDLLALDPAMHKRYGGPNSAEARMRISEAYMKYALLAEEHTEPDVAASAYQKAIEWNPRAAKAKFNLAGIYIEQKKFNLAEKEYRALLAADPNDYEAQYWLAESILSQEPDAARTAEACAALKEALKTKDPEKKTLSTALSIMANCQK